MNKDNSGVLFGRDKDEVKSEKHPTHSGTALIDGKEHKISAWLNTSQKGKKYLSLKFNEPKPKDESVSSTPKPAFDESDIPF